MEHTIVIFKRLKKRNEKGSFGFSISKRYKLTDSDIEKQETEKYNKDHNIDLENESYLYYAEIEKTEH